jgi:glycosyltransferase involved in cell wall biosynthesis
VLSALKKLIPLQWKTQVLTLQAHLHRFREARHYAHVIPRKNQFFCIVSCERNAGEGAIRCLDSVFTQTYDRQLTRHIFIDDASTDNTHTIIQNWLEAHPGHSVEYIHNTQRQGGCANTLKGFQLAPIGSIIAELNGDDWFPDPGVLDFLNKVYDDPDVWMTYNTNIYPNGTWRTLARPYPKKTVEQNAFRDDRWYGGSLHTFRDALLPHVREESLIDPETGQYWANADDMAFYWCLFELAGHHARHIYRPVYVYDVRDYSEIHADPGGQESRATRIRKMQRYAPLQHLESITQMEQL